MHSWLRWVVIAAGLFALAHAWRGVLTKRGWGARARLPSTVFVGVMDLQFLLGLVLYVFVSPLTSAAFADLGAAMKNPPLRFWAVEHGPTMLLVLVLLHVGSVRARRATTDVVRYRRTASWFTVAFVLMLAAVPWPWLDIGRPLFR
jgi:hypothetical protein